MWHEQSNGWAKDDHGHDAGPGTVAGLKAAGWMGVDGLASETPYDGAGSVYLPLANNHVVLWSKAHGTQVDQAAPALVALEAEIRVLRAELAIAKAQPPAPVPAPSDPVAARALAALQDFKSALAEL